ncbi:hypothetical protein GC089_01120 [Cellulomonas sp. JZ18]|uniref:hypothetical protein n=1 Tax=Cellulomonas sp. JZ18 TaxID=2654191 RepID=UPI0012D375D3|nr:hypothetical protein [Cellulomonas sp. JZ18]QGQ18123.1 hypothetical protein GC089_01120 [Cellulomonas sp. JZ18]
MSHPTADPVVSAVPYQVLDVGGQPPRALGDFTGTLTMRVHGATGEHLVCGQGTAADHHAVVQEKTGDGTGKDVRRWRVAADGDGFVAISG